MNSKSTSTNAHFIQKLMSLNYATYQILMGLDVNTCECKVFRGVEICFHESYRISVAFLIFHLIEYEVDKLCIPDMAI